MTREMAYWHPELFAAISPSNGPWFDTRSMQMIDESKPPKDIAPEVRQMMEQFEREGWEMPCAFFYGDRDPAAEAETNPALSVMLRANHCMTEPVYQYTKDNYFTEENSYKEGDRFHTEVYCMENKEARVCVTVMKNMPHGAITEESRFAWSFLKRFRRLSNSKAIELVK